LIVDKPESQTFDEEQPAAGGQLPAASSQPLAASSQQIGANNMSPTISVIIPVYQVKDYLAECLDSVFAQDETFSDFEVVCVDDGSTDGSADILKQYASKDPRLRIITQENSGLSAARNTGIEAARGRYVMFLDSDDMLTPDALATVASAFAESDAEIVTFAAYLYPEGTHDEWLEQLFTLRDVTYQGFSPQLMFEENAQPYVWRTAYSTRFLLRTGLRFDSTVAYGEDAVFMFLAYPQAACTRIIPAKLYYYRLKREGSLMATRRASTTQRLRDHFVIVSRILAGWSALGILHQYASWIWEWVVQFLAYDISVEDRNDQVMLLEDLSQAVSPYLTESDLASIKLMPASRSILKTMRSGTHSRHPYIRWSQMMLYLLTRRLRRLFPG